MDGRLSFLKGCSTWLAQADEGCVEVERAGHRLFIDRNEAYDGDAVDQAYENCRKHERCPCLSSTKRRIPQFACSGLNS